MLPVAAAASAGVGARRDDAVGGRLEHADDVGPEEPALRTGPRDLHLEQLTRQPVPHEHDLALMTTDDVAAMGHPIGAEDQPRTWVDGGSGHVRNSTVGRSASLNP